MRAERYAPVMPAGQERRVLTLVGQVMGMLDLEELCHGMIAALHEVVPVDMVAMSEVPPELPHTISISVPSVPEEFHVAFAAHAHENPLVERYAKTQDGRAYRFSDVLTRRELHRLTIYREVYGPLGVECQIAFTLAGTAERFLGVVLSRGNRDFTGAERDLLNAARPYLIQAYRNAVEHTRLARAAQGVDVGALVALGLTERQAEVLRLVAMGRSDRAAATELGIAPRTAQKRLENAYRTLGVSDRSEASLLVWATVQT